MNASDNTQDTLQNLSNLQLSGSLIAKDRITIPFEAEASDTSTGYIFAPSKKQVYNSDELRKIINLNIEELIANGFTLDDLVARPPYNSTLESLVTAYETIDTQTQQISDLLIQIQNLTAQKIIDAGELDKQIFYRGITDANSNKIKEQLALMNVSFQSIVQRSSLQGVETATLTAKDEGLIAQVESLKVQISAAKSEYDMLYNLLVGNA